MLRISVHETPGELRLHLEGRLAGPWVSEVETCWRTAQSIRRGRPVVVNLQDVDFVDVAGERLLGAMHQCGATFLAAGPLITSMLATIRGESE